MMKQYIKPEAQMLTLVKEDILSSSAMLTLEGTGFDNAENFGEFHPFGF